MIDINDLIEQVELLKIKYAAEEEKDLKIVIADTIISLQTDIINFFTK